MAQQRIYRDGGKFYHEKCLNPTETSQLEPLSNDEIDSLTDEECSECGDYVIDLEVDEVSDLVDDEDDEDDDEDDE